MILPLSLETEFPGETPFLFIAILPAIVRVVEFLMPILNAEHAIVEIRKLRHYCLNPLHQVKYDESDQIARRGGAHG